MATKLKDKDPLAFLKNYTADDLRDCIRRVVAELAREYDLLRQAKERPRPITDADKKLLGTVRNDLTTVDLTDWRIIFYEGVQDRLWHWYKHRLKECACFNGQAAELGNQGK